MGDVLFFFQDRMGNNGKTHWKHNEKPQMIGKQYICYKRIRTLNKEKISEVEECTWGVHYM